MEFSSNGICVSLLLLLLLVLFSSTFTTIEALIKLSENNETFPGVIVFGDSIVDTGNNNYVKTIAKCNYPPYGRNFMGGVASGRFSNGKVPADMIVQELGIKEFLPPYLDPTLQPNDLITGVNFASGGAGYDPLTSKLLVGISLEEQLKLFREYITKLKSIVGEDRTNMILAKSLFGVVVGSNDIANNYYVIGARRLQYDISSYTDLVVSFASDFVKKIYELGARRIGVFGLPPLGCIPAQRTLKGGLTRECAEDSNQASIMCNTKLSSMVDSLKENLPQSRLVYVDLYSPLMDLIQNPSKYGFKVIGKGCCGTGTIEVIELCNQFSPLTCTDDSSYIFWDSFHPTEKAYGILVPRIVQRYYSSFF